MSNLHPLLAAVVKDHHSRREAAAHGRRMAEETTALIRKSASDRIANFEEARRYAAQHSAASKPLSLAEGLEKLTDDFRRMNENLSRIYGAR